MQPRIQALSLQGEEEGDSLGSRLTKVKKNIV